MVLKRILLAVVTLTLTAAVTAGCSSNTKGNTVGEKLPAEKEAPSLKDVYKEYFPIGAAVSPEGLIRFDEILKKHFNSVTAENVMKFSEIHPSEDTYSFNRADAIIDYAVKNNMKVRGHTLAWHQQVPDWVFVGPDGKEASKELVLKRLEEHIKTVVGRYKGKVYAWDVVNEAIDDGNLTLRQTPWSQITGEEFIKKAFQWAHEADPEAQLFYNDYNLEIPQKREKAYKLLKELKEQGIPITGVGLQGHYTINWPSIKDINDSIERFASLGLKVQITELDVSYYSWDDKSSKYSDNPQEVQELQAKRYGEMFELFRKHRETVTSVTLWGVTDDSSWLNYTPVTGRNNWPLIFDSNLKPKEAFWRIVEFK
jgi:endo-1,4-beta-xylanase